MHSDRQSDTDEICRDISSIVIEPAETPIDIKDLTVTLWSPVSKCVAKCKHSCDTLRKSKRYGHWKYLKTRLGYSDFAT